MELEYWLKLNNARSLSPLVCTRLLKCFGSARAVCGASAVELAAYGVKPVAIAELQQPDLELLTKQQHWAEQPQQIILTLEDERYPSLLKMIADPPPVLFIRGDPAALSQPQLAMVGSRNPSPGGVKIANELAAALTETGFTITSGLATGIDSASHRGALSARGSTIAVLGSGLDCIYPAGNQRLAGEIISQGALISEFSPEIKALPGHFPRRNRIISGMSYGVCVVEAALKSGSLITARLAAEQGREVFAVPGSVYNPLTRGCHFLIQEGAKLVMEPADILAELKQAIRQCSIIASEVPGISNRRDDAKLDYDCRQLLQCVGFEATTVDEMVQSSHFSVAKVTELLLVLELQGYVHSAPGGYYRV